MVFVELSGHLFFIPTWTSASHTGLDAALSRYAAFSSLLIVPSCLYCGMLVDSNQIGFLC